MPGGMERSHLKIAVFIQTVGYLWFTSSVVACMINTHCAFTTLVFPFCVLSFGIMLIVLEVFGLDHLNPLRTLSEN